MSIGHVGFNAYLVPELVRCAGVAPPLHPCDVRLGQTWHVRQYRPAGQYREHDRRRHVSMHGVDPIDDLFKPVLGRPSWSVERGRESALFRDRPLMVFLEFGDPVLTIMEPRNWPVHIEGVPAETPGRLTFLRGRWHLTLTSCAWSLTLNSALLATSLSEGNLIDRALDVLNGQALVAVGIDPDDARTVFEFDFGCVLTTYPKPDDGDAGPSEQWVLATASRSYLSVRSDGQFKIRPVTESASTSGWAPILRGQPTSQAVIARPRPNQ